jgi:hypothetical protein
VAVAAGVGERVGSDASVAAGMVCVGGSAVAVEVVAGVAGRLAAAGVEQAAGSRVKNTKRLNREIRIRYISGIFIFFLDYEISCDYIPFSGIIS